MTDRHSPAEKDDQACRFVSLVELVRRWANDKPTGQFDAGKVEASKLIVDDITAMHEWVIDAEHSAREWKKACAAKAAEIAKLETELSRIRDLQFSPTGDNHHNAAMCPHCGAPLRKALAEIARLKDEQRKVAQAYNPNCEEYHFAEQIEMMQCAAQVVEQMQELAVGIGEDPEGGFSLWVDTALGMLNDKDEEITRLKHRELVSKQLHAVCSDCSTTITISRIPDGGWAYKLLGEDWNSPFPSLLEALYAAESELKQDQGE